MRQVIPLMIRVRWVILLNLNYGIEKKKGNRQRVLQTVTSPRVVSLVFRGQGLLKIANINLQQEATLSLWKKLVPRESGGNGA